MKAAWALFENCISHMSLRAEGEAIAKLLEIATLPVVARNDEKARFPNSSKRTRSSS